MTDRDVKMIAKLKRLKHIRVVAIMNCNGLSSPGTAHNREQWCWEDGSIVLNSDLAKRNTTKFAQL